MNERKYQNSILIFILFLFANTKIFAYQPTNKEAIDSIVIICKQKIGYMDNTNNKLISLYLENKNSIKNFTLSDHLTVIIELKSNNDTLFTKEFYSVNNELIFLNEKHIIYKTEEMNDTLGVKSFIVGYDAKYYIIDNFLADGDTRYSYDFLGYNYDPEPISYVLKMIKQHHEYITSK